MKKRLIAWLLVLSTLLGLLSGCKGNDNTRQPGADEEDSFTNGELLVMICDAFGMYDYAESTPYLKSVSAGNPYFGAVQTCVEWDIISPDAQDYDVDAEVTRGELALALVNAAVLTDLEDSDEEKLAVAAGEGLVPLSGGKIDEEAAVSRAEAEASVALAVRLWAGKEFTENVQEVTVQDGVADLTAAETWVDVNSGSIYVPVSAGQIQAGDVFIYDTDMGWTAAKAESVVEEDGYYVITESDEEFELEDIMEDILVQETFAPDLASMPFTDGNGVVHMPGESGGSDMSMTGTAGNVHKLTASSVRSNELKAGGKFKFTVKDVDVEVEVSSGSVKVSAKTVTNEDKKGNEISGLSGSIELNNIIVTNEVDYKVFSGLKSLVSKVNYGVKLQGGVSTKWVEKICAPYNNGNGKFLTNVMRTNFLKTGENGWRNISDKGASSITGKQITIGSWPLVEGGLVQVKLELKLNFSITGEITATLELANTSGIEYRDGKLRVIKESSSDYDLQFKCKAELTAGPGIAVKILNKWDVAEAALKLGVGLEASATVHMFDEELHLIETYEQGSDGDLALAGLEANGSLSIMASPNAILAAAQEAGVNNIELPVGDVELKTDICLEVRAYWILKGEVNILPFLSKLTKTDTKFTFDFLPGDKANIHKWHIEEFNFANPLGECTKEYTPFAYLEEEDEDTGVGAQRAGALDLDAYLLLFEDDTPQKLEAILGKDEEGLTVTWSCDNPAVATVDQNGNVTPVGIGMTLITAALEVDPRVYVKCAVYVQEIDLTDPGWEFLPTDTSAVDWGNEVVSVGI